MVAIDSDVLIIDLVFRRDVRFATNARFLGAVRSADPAVTIYNLMEILGKLSLNVPEGTLGRWPDVLTKAYGLTVIWPGPSDVDADAFYRDEIYLGPLALMQAQRLAYLDALVLSLVARAPAVETFVTWNARHFRDKTAVPVLTPKEYLTANPLS